MRKTLLLIASTLVLTYTTSLAATYRNYSGYQYRNGTTNSTYTQPTTTNTYAPVATTSSYTYSDRSIQMFNSIIYLQGGVAIPTGAKDMESPEFGNKLRYGDVGGRFDASYTFFVNPYFGLGAEMGGTWFSEDKNQFIDGDERLKESYKMSLFNLFVTGRFNLNPQDPVRVYIPFGGGLTAARGTYSLSYQDGSHHHSHNALENSGTTYSLGWFAGLGIEIESYPNFVWGAEVRYSDFAFDKSEYGWEHTLKGYTGTDRYGYLSVLFKLGFRF